MIKKAIIISLFIATAFAVSPTYVSFNTGQVSPLLEARIDFQKYPSSCRTVENMFVTVHGSAVRRSGTRYVAEAAAAIEGGVTPRPDPDPTKIGISTMAELALIGNDGEYPLNGDYELLNNLDADGITFWPIGHLIGQASASNFTGTFDGNFFTISNMTIGTDITDGLSSTGQAGLFWACGGATIENLTISNMTIIGPPDQNPVVNFGAGLLTASALHPTVLTNCHTQGTIISAGRLLNVGGLSGQTNAALNICSANVTISCSGEFMNKCGGLAGSGGGLNMANCYAQGTISYTGSQFGMSHIGGLFGAWGGASSTTDNCYSAIVITGIIDTRNGNVAGFVGNDTGTPVYTSNYWDNDLIETPPAPLDDTGNAGDVAGILKSTTTPMQQQASYIGWNFDTIWTIQEGSDYPRFQWQEYAENLEKPYLSGNDNIRLIPFTVSTDDSYALEFGNQYIRFFRDSELD